jgi:hypothetical protein
MVSGIKVFSKRVFIMDLEKKRVRRIVDIEVCSKMGKYMVKGGICLAITILTRVGTN